MNYTPINNIPQFGLYGESDANQDPGFVHIEEIAARSIKNKWIIKPHRHGRIFQILCMFDSEALVELDKSHSTLKGNWAITVPSGVVHGYQFAPGTNGIVLSIAEPFLNDENYSDSQQYFFELTHSAQTIEFKGENVLFDQLKSLLGMIKNEFQVTGTGQNLMLDWLVRMVLMTLKRQSDISQLQSSTSIFSNPALTGFRKLLEQNYKSHWNVQQYACALHISVSTLNRLCNDAVGASAKIIIQNRIHSEAKKRLIYTREPLDQIAYNLGYKDPAYFSRIFKKLEGLTPSNYRKMKDGSSS